MSNKFKYGYCSWCYQLSKQKLHEENILTKNVYKCVKCKNLTVECTACKNMAKGPLTEKQKEELEKNSENNRGFLSKLGDNWKNEFCAEHDGSIADFTKLNSKIKRLDEYFDLFQPKSVNLTKVGAIAAGTITSAGIVGLTLTTGGGGAALAAAAGKLGVLGTATTGTAISSLSGAALTSASLAAVGGSVAAGTAIITAAGAGLGGVAGSLLTTKYVGEDKYLGFHNKKSSKNMKTIFINGFLQQEEVDFLDWTSAHEACFPEEGLYGMTWNSKDLYELGMAFADGVRTEIAKALLIKIAKSGSKKFNPLGPVVTAIGLAGNPWHVSMIRAAKAGAILADAIMRSKEAKFNLVGHSLGCRVIYYALEALSTNRNKKVEDVILLGGAVGKDDTTGWRRATSAVRGTVFNCYSKNDHILSKLYTIANANLSHPIGISKIPITQNIKNIDCSNFIDGHMSWKDNYEEILRRIYN